MNRKTVAPLLLAFIVSVAIAGCDRSKALPETANGPGDTPMADQPSTASEAQPAATSAPPRDGVSAEDLKSGLDAITPLIVSTQDGFGKIEAKYKSRFFMHPDMEKNAAMEFDTSSLASLTLAPLMEDFSSQECAGNPEAGVVQVTWTLDGGEPHHFMVDRDYTGTVDVDLRDAKRLKVEVDKGNNVTWCDWFSLGVTNVVKK